VHVLTTVDEPLIKRLRGEHHFFWIDLVRPSADEIKQLGRALGLHPVALEDTLEFGQRPKVDTYDDQLLFVYYTAKVPAKPIEVHIYISGDFISTIRHDDCMALDDLHGSLSQQPTHDEEVLVYRIFDGLTDAYYPVIEALEHEIDQLEADVLNHPRRELLTTSYRLKQNVRGLHRLAAAQHNGFDVAHDAILALPGFEKSSKPYLRDVGDHLNQISSEFQRQAEDLFSLTQTYFNANADRLNATATRITIGGTIFVAWTVITGFFGQNFKWLTDHVESRHAFLFFGVGGLIIPTVILITLFWVKRHDWF